MRSLFSLHAGELLVAEEIKRQLPGVDIWVPLRDTGVDLLVTRGACHAGIQVKFSSDVKSRRSPGTVAKGWWTFKASKIRQSAADVWVLVIYPLPPASPKYLVITPQELAERMARIFGDTKDKFRDPEKIQSFIEVMGDGRCWEMGGLHQGEGLGEDRDLSRYLGAWLELERRLHMERDVSRARSEHPTTLVHRVMRRSSVKPSRRNASRSTGAARPTSARGRVGTSCPPS